MSQQKWAFRLVASAACIPTSTARTCLARYPRLSFGDRLNCDASLVDKLVEPPADDGIAATVDDKRGFNKIGRG